MEPRRRSMGKRFAKRKRRLSSYQMVYIIRRFSVKDAYSCEVIRENQSNASFLSICYCTHLSVRREIGYPYDSPPNDGSHTQAV